jgi:hypothetical protein
LLTLAKPQWVSWKHSTRTKLDGTTYVTKVPVCPHNNGNATKMHEPEEWDMQIQPGLSLFDTIAIGTAGYTTALAIQMLKTRETPGAGSEVHAHVGYLLADVFRTGGFVVVPTGRTPRHVDGLLTSLLYEDGDGPVYAIEGTVHGLASSIVEAGRRGGWDALPPERIAARSGPASRFPRVEAAIEGTGTPDWKPASPFAVEAGEYGPEEVVRGTLEDLALRFARIAELLRASGSCPPRFVATGGLAYAPHLTSRLSDVMATPVDVDPGPHRTAVGAALLARDGR